MNKDQAALIANQTFNKVNSASKATKLELLDVALGNQTIWKASFDTDGELQIDANDGKIKFLINKKALRDEPSSKSPLNKDPALKKAREKAVELELFIPQSPPSTAKLVSKGKNFWTYTWPREYNGYKFHDDWISISVMADSGEILGYNMRYFSSNPSSLDIKIDKTKAGEMAKYIAEEKKFTLETTNATIIIVNPNYRWTGNYIKIPPAETKLAWIIPFTKPEGKGEIWVDTLTGGMLGGIETK